MKINFFTVLASLSLLSFSSFSQSVKFKNEFGFKSDNDSYLAQGSDRYYTNGLFLYFRHAVDQSGDLSNIAKKTWEVEAGQKMYNAQSGYIPDIDYVDRTITAYLYAGGSFNWFFANEQVLKVSAQAGVIGPAALGEEAQKLIHRIAGFYEPNSWKYQLNNEFEVNTSVNYTRLLARTGPGTVDISFSGNADIGTTFSNAGAGLLIRLGDINPLFKSASSNSRISNGQPDDIDREFFFYLKPQLRAIVYDGTVSGGIFLSDKGPVTFDTKPLVFSQELGGMYAKNRWTLSLAAIFNTREIKSFARAHQWGMASVFYRFN